MQINMLIYSRIQAGINSDAPGVLAYGDLNFLMITTNKGQGDVVRADFISYSVFSC
jgi:hypothetical protein